MRDMKNGIQYTFDSFAVTKANSEAFEKAKQFAENVDFKPFAVFGGTATGKTHLPMLSKMPLSRIRRSFM